MPAPEIQLARGAFCISIDVERGWGVWDRPTVEYLERCLRYEDEIVERLLTLFGRFGIVATWAVVGQLLEPLDTYPVPFDSRVWYAPDLLERIARVTPKQEIASHSFRHIYFDQVSFDEARQDTAQARRVHRERGVPLDAWVYPRNGVAHTGALAEVGVRVFRSVDQGWHIGARRRFGRQVGRAANLVEKLVPTAATVRPRRHASGMTELPSSLLLMGRNGARRLIPPAVLRAKAVNGLRRAAAERSIFHLWFHPSNFYYAIDVQFGILEGILRTAVQLRERGELQVVPMGHFVGTG